MQKKCDIIGVQTDNPYWLFGGTATKSNSWPPGITACVDECVPHVPSRWSCRWSQGRCWSWTVGWGDTCGWSRCGPCRRPSRPPRNPDLCPRRWARERRWKIKHSTSWSLHASATKFGQKHETARFGRCFSLPEGAHLQSREALCRATEKEVIPPCSSPSRGEGEMLEHSRYPQWTSLRYKKKKTINKSGTGQIKPTVEAEQCFRMDILTVCYTGSRCPCPSHSCPSPSPRCLTSRSRTCQQPLPLAETTGALGYRGLDLTAAVQKWRAQTITYSLPTNICTACLWFYTCRWSSAPAGETHPVTHHLPCRSRGFRS